MPGNDRRGHRLWTVNWHALQSKPDILFRNERSIQILQTRNFGPLGLIAAAQGRALAELAQQPDDALGIELGH